MWELYEGTRPAEVLLEDSSAVGGKSVPLVLFVWTLRKQSCSRVSSCESTVGLFDNVVQE